MADEESWTVLGALVQGRRQAQTKSGRAMEKAGGPSEPTWRRIEGGHAVEPASLYRICSALLLEEGEAREWFDLVGFNFDAAAYERPEALAQLTEAFEQIKRGAELGLAAAARIEAESRRSQ